MAFSVLIIDDECVLASNIACYLEQADYAVQTANSGADGLALLKQAHPDVILLDYRLGDTDGLTLLSEIQAIDNQIPVIFITGNDDVQIAVRAMKAGCYDYLSKPLVLAELKLLVERALEQRRIQGTLAYYQNRQAEASGLDKLLGESPAMHNFKQQLQRFIEAEQRLIDGTPPAVLISGETGTGKELVARAFHFTGQRKDKPFIEINCASIPAQLLEAELFGFERGAFTDAKQRKLGLVETANGGTLFLDEIAEMDLTLQAKLLKLIEDKRLRRLGGVQEQQVDVRIVAATNRSLDELVREHKFRADLLFRLRVIAIELPPLRQRGDDIMLLAEAFLRWHGQRYGRSGLLLGGAAAKLLRRYHWPGNVRELRNVIEQAVLLADVDVISPQHLNLQTTMRDNICDDSASAASQWSGELNLEKLEFQAINKALNDTGWNISHAARLLGISRDTLRYRLDKHQLG